MTATTPRSSSPHTASNSNTTTTKYRASLGAPTLLNNNNSQQHTSPISQPQPTSSSYNHLRATAPGGRASTGGFQPRPSSEFTHSTSTTMNLQQGNGGGNGGGMNQSQGVFHSAETEAIDRWFEDLQHYEATLEEMAAASLDSNFKEELSAIEQWFRVLSEAERTAALYSLLQSATQMQMRFFITVLQQMARQDPTQAALLSPANPSQLSLEAQMEAKLSSLNLSSNPNNNNAPNPKSPSSPMVRQFARSSLGTQQQQHQSEGGYLSPNPSTSFEDQLNNASSTNATNAASVTLANQRAKLKASARTSAPANLLLGGGGSGSGTFGGGSGLGEGLKSPLWSKEETVRERSPSPRPHSTGSTGDAPSNSQSQSTFLRSPALDASFPGGGGGLENQLSPLVGGNWASMVNTPIVPMFGKNGDQMEPGNFGQSPNPNLGESLGSRLENWRNSGGGGNQSQQQSEGGIVLDDVRKFRRSARVSGGALSGMYEGGDQKESASSNNLHQSATTAQRRVQDQLAAVQQLKNMQQSALSLGLGSLPSPGLNQSSSSNSTFAQQQQGQPQGGGSRVGSSGALNSPGLQQTAMQAQQNWRNANAPLTSPSSFSHSNNSSSNNYAHQQSNNNNNYGLSPNVQSSFGGGGNDQFAANIGLGTNLPLPSGLGSPASASSHQQQHQAQQQLASLIALQQQMMQQQQQLQTLAGMGGGLGVGLGGLGMMGTGANLSPNMNAMGIMGVGGAGTNGQQISPRLGGGGSSNGFGGGGGFGGGIGLGMGGSGMPSPRRSPRPHDHQRSPASFPMSTHRSQGGGSSSSNQLPPGSGSNPDEPLDFSLLGDTPSWLRSLRLHKYTPNFEGFGWKEMVKMGDEDLEKRGVSALGARRKLLKVFETVRAKTGMSSPSAPAMDPSTSSDSVADKPVEESKGSNTIEEKDEKSEVVNNSQAEKENINLVDQ